MTLEPGVEEDGDGFVLVLGLDEEDFCFAFDLGEDGNDDFGLEHDDWTTDFLLM